LAEVRPFRGLRYNQDAIGDLSLVVAPPYDVIDDSTRDSYYNRHPYNVIRLILNRPKKSDADGEQPYVRAGEFLERWIAQRIMVRDTVPSIYLYRQRYFIDGNYKECTGLVARVRVEDFESGGIRPHEDIMPKPLADRMNLLEHTMANLDMVQALYSDSPEKLKKPICSEMDRFPLAQFQTSEGIAHDVWAVTDERFVTRIAKFFEGRSLYIADGHHRYQTALEYSRRLRESGEITDENDPRNFLLMMIVEMENPGLSLLPVHRVVLPTDDFDVGRFLGILSRWFVISEVEIPRGARSGQVFHLLKELNGAAGSGRVFGAFTGQPERMMLMTWRPELEVVDAIEGEFSADYKNLDVSVLHKIVIEKVLGVSPERGAVERGLAFTRDPLEAARMVDSGEGAIAFFLNPTRVEQVREVADHGEKMPQKSTYFHPKPCSGVVMSRINEW
jgi:uncharacterized protein (DUF1015 family)